MANVTMIPARVNRRAKREEKETEVPKTRVAAYCRVSTDSDEQASIKVPAYITDSTPDLHLRVHP